jgi:predicted RNA-binding Zn-ribbon protein involved in translation (DUF1610 family)
MRTITKCPYCGAFMQEVHTVRDWMEDEHCQECEDGVACNKCGYRDTKIT